MVCRISALHTHITKNGYISKHTNSNVMDETTNLRLNINNKETELVTIASIETLKRHNKKCSKDEVLALVKDSSEKAITMESFEKYLELLQANHSIKYNIISNRTCQSIPKHSSIPQVNTQNTSTIRNDFEDFKSNFIETLTHYSPVLLIYTP